jgi:cell division transport system ATP-binding protein
MIELSHIYKTYAGPVHALRNVDIQIGKGEFVFITGPSGAGKTTLFRMLAGFDQPTSGQISVAGFNMNEMTLHQKPLFRRKLGVVFQDFKLLKEQTALENVAMPLIIRGENRDKSLELARVFLQKVGLEDRQDMRSESLSGGEQQRIALARAIIHQPDIILADEPTGNLDQERGEEIMNLLEFCAKSGMTVLATTHDLDLVRRRKQRIISIKNGEVVRDGRA